MFHSVISVGWTLPSEAQHLRFDGHIPSFCHHKPTTEDALPVFQLSNHPVQEVKFP